MLNVNDIFPTKVYHKEMPGWVDKVKDLTLGFLDSEKQRQSDKVIQTRNLTHVSELDFLKNYFIKESVHILFGQGYNTDLYNFYARDMWAQEFTEGGFNWPHIHPGSVMVGLYFYQVKQCTPCLNLHDPRPGKTVGDLEFRESEYSGNNQPILSNNNLKEGDFVFLNSWLTHSITLPQAEGTFKFMHFNLSCERKRYDN